MKIICLIIFICISFWILHLVLNSIYTLYCHIAAFSGQSLYRHTQPYTQPQSELKDVFSCHCWIHKWFFVRCMLWKGRFEPLPAFPWLPSTPQFYDVRLPLFPTWIEGLCQARRLHQHWGRTANGSWSSSGFYSTLLFSLSTEHLRVWRGKVLLVLWWYGSARTI